MNRRSFLTRGLKAAAGLAAMVALPQSVGARDEPEPDALVMENIHAHDNESAGISQGYRIGIRNATTGEEIMRPYVIHINGHEVAYSIQTRITPRYAEASL